MMKRKQHAWTPERDALLRRMWAEHYSGSEIARALGPSFSRNAPISRAYKLGLPPHRRGRCFADLAERQEA